MSAYGRQPGERVLNELPFAIWVARAPTCEVLYTNQAGRTILGLAADGDIGGAAGTAYTFYDRQGQPTPHAELPYSRAVASGAPVVADDLVIHRRDGEHIHVRAFANPVLDDQGVVSHVVIALTDITEEVRAVAARADLEQRLAVAVHHAPVMLFMLDRDGVLTAADGALRPALDSGRPGGGLVGVSILEAYKDHPIVPDRVRRALSGETVAYSIEVRGLSLDVWLGPVRDAVGDLVGAIGVCTDVTESRRLQTRAIQSDRIHAMGTVAASVAHEINNPLTYVLAGLEESSTEIDHLVDHLAALARVNGNGAVATMALEGIGRLQEHLMPVIAGTRRIREVARALRTFTRPDDENLTNIEIGGVVRSVLKLVGKEIEARARLVEEVDTIPLVLANEARLVQVLTNLLINAWQAIPDPDPARHVIGVRTGAAPDGAALIEIWDSGPGVPPHLREQIFEPFVTTKEVGAGSGLGLFVCRNIIQALGGRISVHDAPGKGALFRIELPAAPRPVVAPPPVAALAPRAAWTRRPRILIIDDDALVAGALESSFAEDADVRTVLDGRQGLDLLLTDDGFDLAYCDVMMKGFSGMDLYEALRGTAPARLTKVVFMSGGAFTNDAQAFLRDRPDAYVQKPFDIVADARRRIG